MKRKLKNSWAILFVAALFTIVSCNKSGEHAEHAATYTCPIHPTVVSDKPGNCPVCGMDLVLKTPDGEGVKITEDLARLMRSPNEAVVSSIKTIKGEYKSVPVSVEAVGVVTYDTRNIYSIPARVGGRMEKIYLKYEFQAVNKGQKIAEIYSAELITAQRELLFLLENDTENEQIISSAKSKLQLLGLTDLQIKDLIKGKAISNTFAMYSPYSGYLLTDDAAPSTSAAMPQSSGSTGAGMSGMASSSSGSLASSGVINTAGSSGSLLKEGNYVSAGQTLFKVVNTNALRIELDLAEAQAGAVNSGDKIELDFGNGEKELSSVDFVQPFFNEGQNFLKIRVYTKKVDDLHIGHLVSAKIRLEAKESLWVPKESVLDLGIDKVVFVKAGGILKPKRITTGIRSGELIEVKSGLASAEEIAANAQYLVDSESFIKPVN